MIPAQPTTTVTTVRSKAAIVAGLRQWFLRAAITISDNPDPRADMAVGIVDATGKLFHGFIGESNMVMRKGRPAISPEDTTLRFVSSRITPLPNAKIQLYEDMIFGFNDIAPVVPTIDLIERDRLPGGPPVSPPTWGLVITIKKTMVPYATTKGELATLLRNYTLQHPELTA